MTKAPDGMLDCYAQHTGYRLLPKTRRLLHQVRREAAIPGCRTQLGAWMFTFARVAAMSEAELQARGCPASEVEPLLRFASQNIVCDLRGGHPDTAAQVADFIREIAALEWGSPEGHAAFVRWLDAGEQRARRRYRQAD